MRVMHILNTGSYSGAENVVITLIFAQQDRVESFYVSLDGSIREVLKKEGINFYPVRKLSVVTVSKAIHDIKPDIIHAHDFTAGLIASVVAGNRPLINHLHNNSPWIRSINLKSIVYGISCWRFNKILTVSESVMNEYVYGQCFRHKTRVVGNPVDIQKIRLEAKASNLTDKTDLIFLGRLSPEKNIFLFLDIVEELAERIPDLRVAVVGDGELKRRLYQTVKQKRLADIVRIYGFQSNPFGLLANSKVMCMPSLWEGFGLTAVEALALGIPVVASPVGGLVHIINQKCGKQCQDKSEYVDEIYRLLRDSNYWLEKSNAAKLRAESYDNVHTYAAMMENEYCALQEQTVSFCGERKKW